MIESQRFQLLLKELECARTERLQVLNNRQLLFNILIASWGVLMTALVFFLGQRTQDPAYFHFGLLLIFGLGLVVNLVSMLRILVNIGELDMARLRIRVVVDLLASENILLEFVKVLRLDFDENTITAPIKHYSSFTPRVKLAMDSFIIGNGILLMFYVSFFSLWLLEAISAILMYTPSPTEKILSCLPGVLFLFAWVLGINRYFKMTIQGHRVRMDRVLKRIRGTR